MSKKFLDNFEMIFRFKWIKQCWSALFSNENERNSKTKGKNKTIAWDETIEAWQNIPAKAILKGQDNKQAASSHRCDCCSLYTCWLHEILFSMFFWWHADASNRLRHVLSLIAGEKKSWFIVDKSRCNVDFYDFSRLYQLLISAFCKRPLSWHS